MKTNNFKGIKLIEILKKSQIHLYLHWKNLRPVHVILLRKEEKNTG